MTKIQKHVLGAVSMFSLTLALSVALKENMNDTMAASQRRVERSVATAASTEGVVHAAAPIVTQEAAIPGTLERRAQRLQRRAERVFGVVLPIKGLADALLERTALFRKTVAVRWGADDGKEREPWVVSVSAFPHWVLATVEKDGLHFALDDAQMKRTLTEETQGRFPAPVDSTITAVQDEHGNQRVVADRPAESGFVLDADALAQAMKNAFLTANAEVNVPLATEQGRIINETGMELGPLTHIAVGISDFAGSGGGRIANVRKGISEYIHNYLIPPGATFSFNKALNNMEPTSAWRDALVIVNGRDLVPIPGGGICQVATTVYRAALAAGLPIVERANHSLYVTYYEKFGVGIDATIYPKKQDFTFRNDTGNYVLLQAYTKGFEASVHVYGAPDGRSVAMEGPFFQSNASTTFLETHGSVLRANEIGWLQRVTHANGEVSTNVILSRYLAIPKKLRTQYAQAENAPT